MRKERSSERVSDDDDEGENESLERKINKPWRWIVEKVDSNGEQSLLLLLVRILL